MQKILDIIASPNWTKLQRPTGSYPASRLAIVTYGYDPLGRLSKVTKDGEMLRTYGYDAFGNRTHMTEGDRETAYTYNAMNQLMSRMDSMSEETYAYDRRGNLSLIMENGSLKNSYTYGALNRLEQAVNGNGEAAAYEYNGLGHRVGKVVGSMKGPDGSYPAVQGMDIPNPMGNLKEQSLNPETKIRYTIDLTRGYHNQLEKEEAGSRQTYLWDGNVAGMREEKKGQNGWSNLSNHPDTSYYLQDELGSPIRLLDEEGNMRETYGYDEFGQDLYRNQGHIQPFGYTGYQSDRIADTYYAQAREYRAERGRFAGVDIIKGFAAAPYTLNEYGYCWGNPMVLVDLDGREPENFDFNTSEKKDAEYVGAVYLVNEDGAKGNGHAATLLVKGDGTAEFYSYAGKANLGAFTVGSEGYLSTCVDDKGNPISINIEDFVNNGGAYADSVNSKGVNTSKIDSYSNGVYIPITNEEGISMHDKAMQIRDNPGKYNLWNHNCGQVAQLILQAGDKNFAATKFAWWNTRPNSVYDNIVDEIDAGERESWQYGSLEQLGLNDITNVECIEGE